MKSLIENKLGELINVNSRDSSVFTTINNQHLDLSKYINYNEVENFFLNNTSTIRINLNNANSNLIRELKQTKSFEKFVKIVYDNGLYLPTSRLKLLKNDFNGNKESIIEYIDKYYSDIIKRILSIYSKAKGIRNDKGSWNLFVTKYLLTGVTKNKNVSVRAPLLLVPIDISYDKKNKIIDLKKIDDEFILNEKLVIYLLRAANKENRLLNEFEFVNNIDSFVNKLKSTTGFDIKTITNDYNTERTPFKSIKLKDIPLLYDGLYVEDIFTFGIYEPSGGKLKQDLEEIIKLNKHKHVFDSLVEGIPNYVIEQQEMNGDPLIQIGKLDIYQKLAVRSSLQQSTIIHGPPGTGKSEVISNIIANILLSNKSIVMVSEKRAALDVLHKRLKKLSVFTLKTHTDDKDEFYDNILELEKLIGKDWQYSNDDMHINHCNQSNEYLKNKKYNNALINKINAIFELENLKYDEIDYQELNKQIIQSLKQKEIFDEINKNNVIQYLEKIRNQMNVDDTKFIRIVNDFYNYLVENNLTKENEYLSFSIDIDRFIRYANDFDFNFDDIDKVAQIKKCSQTLSNFLAQNIRLEKILKENPYSIFNAIKAINNAKKELNGIIYCNFFNDIDNIHNKISAFLNFIKHSKKSSIKYFLDEFVCKNNFVRKKPISKLFYKRKLNETDNKILELFEKIKDTAIDSITNFELIYQNEVIFDPLVVMYFFNKKIFDQKYINFIKKGFDRFEYNLFLIQKKFNFNESIFKSSRNLVKAYNNFCEKSSEINDEICVFNAVKDFNKIAWDYFVNLILDEVRLSIWNKLSSLKRDDKNLIIEAIRVAGLKRRPAIFKYLETFKLALQQLFPIWIAKPEQVSLYTPLKENFFDYGIYDEASQMFLERAYPLIFRSKINIIAGDEHQLRPSSFFVSRSDDEDDEDEYDIADYDIQESLLDRGMVTSWNNVVLKNHYRSERKELINFSNKYIYNNELNYASINDSNTMNGIDVINTKGYFVDGKNLVEADKTLQILDLVVNKYKSILIITTNNKQLNHLNNLINTSDNINPKIMEMISENKLEIVSIENVQGNEADLVIFSIGYAKKDNDSKLASRFGPIMKSGGKNRLNVAITRAKKKMIVIKSMNASEINISNIGNKDLIVFRDFIAFCDNIFEKQKQHIKNNTKQKEKNNSIPSFTHDVINTIYKDVINKKLIIDTNYEIGSKSIDIVIIDPQTSKVVIGIEINQWKQNNKPFKMLEEIYRQQFLNARGYQTIVIFESEWYSKKDLIINELFSLINDYLFNR